MEVDPSKDLSGGGGQPIDDEPGYLAAYAVIRVDDGPLDHPSRVREYVSDGLTLPAAGPTNVKVKEVVTSADEARREVMRLNTLHSGKGCRYYWQATHVFLDGRSHGSGERGAALAEDDV